MIPPQMQFNLEELFSAGMLAIFTVAQPGDQGACVTGVHVINATALGHNDAALKHNYLTRDTILARLLPFLRRKS